MRRNPSLNQTLRYVWLALLFSVGANADAQTWPTYAVTKLQPVGGSNSQAQNSTAWAINNSGTVVGWTAKSAGTITQYNMTFNAAGFPNLFGPYEVSHISAWTTSPVMWSGGKPTVLPRVSNAYNTLARDILDDGTILMEVADTNRKTTSMSGTMQGIKAHWRIYRAGAFKIPTIGGARIPAIEADDKVSAYLGPAGELVVHTGPTNIKIWANGSVQQLQVPAPDGAAASKARLMRLWPGAQGWLTTETAQTDAATKLPFTTYNCLKGAVSQLQALVKEPGMEGFQCLAMNAQGVIFGVALKRVQQFVNDYGIFSSYFEWQPAGHYMIEGATWSRVALLDGKTTFGGAFMDEQGRVVTRASVFSGEPKIRAILIQHGVARPLQELTNAPIGEDQLFTIADMNDKGQILIQILGFDASSGAMVLTPQ